MSMLFTLYQPENSYSAAASAEISLADKTYVPIFSDYFSKISFFLIVSFIFFFAKRF
jgi:hypothetical protein